MTCPYLGGPFLVPLRELRATAEITAKAPQIPTGSQAWDRGGDRMKSTRALTGLGHTVALVLNLFTTRGGAAARPGHQGAVVPRLYCDRRWACNRHAPPRFFLVVGSSNSILPVSEAINLGLILCSFYSLTPPQTPTC